LDSKTIGIGQQNNWNETTGQMKWNKPDNSNRQMDQKRWQGILFPVTAFFFARTFPDILFMGNHSKIIKIYPEIT